jgi:uncharacterized membrane protein YoaT (DUF817 family)
MFSVIDRSLIGGSLLVIMTFTIVASLKHVKAKIHIAPD